MPMVFDKSARTGFPGAVAILFFAASCATGETAPVENDDAAYQQCLRDNMAAAVAWEMIEDMCRKQASGAGAPPLEP